MLTIYRVISRASSIRWATESRIDRAEVEAICMRLPRCRSNVARGASNSGALMKSCPGRCAAKAFDPMHRSDQLVDLPETGQHPDHENEI